MRVEMGLGGCRDEGSVFSFFSHPPFFFFTPPLSALPQLPACAYYRRACPPRPSPRSPACSSPGPLPAAPTAASLATTIGAACGSHGMSECAACPGAAPVPGAACPAPAATLAALCAAMPGMSACAALETVCATPAPVGPGADGRGGAAVQFPGLCGGAAGAAAATTARAAGSGMSPPPPPPLLPPMRMWLHADAGDIVLARQWVPRSPLATAAACVAVAGAGVAAQAIRGVRAVAEGRWAAAARRGGGARPSFPSRASRNAVRAALTFALSLVDLLLMLVAMTFSWPLIVSGAFGWGERERQRSGGVFFLSHVLLSARPPFLALLTLSLSLPSSFTSVAGGYALGTLLMGHFGEAGAPGGPSPRPSSSAPGGGGGGVGGWCGPADRLADPFSTVDGGECGGVGGLGVGGACAWAKDWQAGGGGGKEMGPSADASGSETSTRPPPAPSALALTPPRSMRPPSPPAGSALGTPGCCAGSPSAGARTTPV